MENNKYKCLSLLQPWASLCVHTDSNGKALKQIETRSWNTKYRGELLIHSSKGKAKYPKELIDQLNSNSWFNENIPLPYGAIIGKVDLVLTYPTIFFVSPSGVKRISDQEIAFGDYSPDRYGWMLSNPILFKEPIPCKGQLSIWNLPTELVPLVNRQIEIATG